MYNWKKFKWDTGKWNEESLSFSLSKRSKTDSSHCLCLFTRVEIEVRRKVDLKISCSSFGIILVVGFPPVLDDQLCLVLFYSERPNETSYDKKMVKIFGSFDFINTVIRLVLQCWCARRYIEPANTTINVLVFGITECQKSGLTNGRKDELVRCSSWSLDLLVCSKFKCICDW